MQFKLASVVSLLAVVSPALAINPTAHGIMHLLDSAVDIRDVVKTATLVNAAQKIPNVFQKYSSFIDFKTTLIEKFPSQMTLDDQRDLCENYVNFATVSQDMLEQFYEKGPALAATPYKDGIRAILSQDDSLTKTLSTNVKGVASGCKEKIADSAHHMEDTYANAISAYD